MDDTGSLILPSEYRDGLSPGDAIGQLSTPDH